MTHPSKALTKGSGFLGSFISTLSAQKRPIINTIGIPEFDDEGIRLMDLIQERLSQVIKSIKVNENLENKIKNALTKEINYIWGKKPFVEVIIHYN